MIVINLKKTTFKEENEQKKRNLKVYIFFELKPFFQKISIIIYMTKFNFKFLYYYTIEIDILEICHKNCTHTHFVVLLTFYNSTIKRNDLKKMRKWYF